MPLTLLRQASPLAIAAGQLEILESSTNSSIPPFAATLKEHGLPCLRAGGIEVLQINLGKVCNQTCRHCHVDAGPDRRESMSRETAEAVLRVLAATDIPTLDITGGAPEMNPNFCWLVEQARGLNRHVIDRSNLTILVAPGFEHLGEFLATQEVEVVASLPCYLEPNCDSQRGQGVFQRSIQALRRLNHLGFARGDSPLTLTLVCNPLGPSLPPPQAKLEDDYRRELGARHGVEFTRLHTITNMPISRFLDDLLRSNQYEAYMQKLVEAFNPVAAQSVMCRTMISVDWQGRLYDCDFNQMLERRLDADAPQTIHDFDFERLATRKIITGRHCFGCTADAGSSCRGRLVE